MGNNCAETRKLKKIENAGYEINRK